jgi:hypothetical protein
MAWKSATDTSPYSAVLSRMFARQPPHSGRGLSQRSAASAPDKYMPVLARYDDFAGFQRVAQGIQCLGGEFWQFIGKQNAVTGHVNLSLLI